ncbi:MAG: hypothetical protein K2Q18_03150 [Bdellovibrionales bacterium]|nr:hypothetical protein [Bdellovibrionales bacterium]
MTSVKDKGVQPLNKNLQNIKPFRGSGAKVPTAVTKAALAPEALSAEGVPDITAQAKNLNANQSAEAPKEKPSESSTGKFLEKASSVASAISKAPIMPILLPTDSKKIEEKISDKKIDKKSEPPIHFIKKPAVIFIEGFSAFGISNGDGIKEMSDNYPGAKRFDWTEHAKIVEEIKKHAPSEPVVLVGHSFGGDTAIEVANELNSAKNGFRPIDLLVSIDAVGMNKTIIPINVKSNLNYFGEGIIPFVHGDPTVARNTKYTEVTNELRTDMHSKMDDSPEVQFEIFQKINEVLGGAGEPDVFIEISETNQIKDVLEALKNSL